MPMVDDDNKDFEKLNKRFPLRPIRDDRHNEEAAGVCDMLLDKIDTLSQSERDYLEVLTDLISKYEARWDDEVADMSPRELVQYLMEQNGLAQKDLVTEFGSASRVSEFLKGERRLSLEQAKRLANRFRLNIAAFIEKEDIEPKSRPVGPAANAERTLPVEPLSLRNLIKRNHQVSYKIFFNAFTRVAEEDDKYLIHFLKRPIEKNSFSHAYFELFNAVNLWLIVARSNKSTSDNASVSENLDANTYLAFLRPEYLAWEDKIRRSEPESKWIKMNRIKTYADFLSKLDTLTQRDFNNSPSFWQRNVNPGQGQQAFEKFAADLYKHLGDLAEES
jgi:HTH-type transcriptional regulator / antitoxin HigA